MGVLIAPTSEGDVRIEYVNPGNIASKRRLSTEQAPVSEASLLVLPSSLPQSGCLVSPSLNAWVTRLLFLKCALWGLIRTVLKYLLEDFIYVKT